MKKLLALLLCIVLLSGCAVTYDGPTEGEYLLTEKTQSLYAYDRVQLTLRTTYAYDVRGNLVQEMEYKDDKLEDASYYRYDDRGNRISERYWDHSGLIPLPKRCAKYTYDDQNQVLTAIHYDGWGRETHRFTYTYDDEANSYTCDDSSGDPSTYYLNEDGQTIRLSRNINGSAYETHYEYDQQGNLLQSTTYRDGQRHSIYQLRYDDQGRKIWEGDFDAEGNLEKETSILFNGNIGTTHYSWGTHYSYYDPDGRIYLTEKYDLDGSLSEVIQYTYQQITVPAEGVETP